MFYGLKSVAVLPLLPYSVADLPSSGVFYFREGSVASFAGHA